MKVGVLFSSGKDSTYVIHLAKKRGHEISCLITMESKNNESYMFHTPNINLAELCAEAMEIPIIIEQTKGKKESELEDLKKVINNAKKKYEIEGIVTGALSSTYQGARIQNICNDLNLWCFNPLWQKNQIELLNELVDNKFKVMIVGVFAYPFDESWLGEIIDKETISKLKELQQKYKINPAGEGGETESLVIDSPLHKKRIKITKSTKTFENYAGVFNIEEAFLEPK